MTTTPTPAAELLAAAGLLDALIADRDHASAKWWEPEADLREALTGHCCSEEHARPVAAYIRTTNPDVGRALVALLRANARSASHMSVTAAAPLTEVALQSELALARAILATSKEI